MTSFQWCHCYYVTEKRHQTNVTRFSFLGSSQSKFLAIPVSFKYYPLFTEMKLIPVFLLFVFNFETKCKSILNNLTILLKVLSAQNYIASMIILYKILIKYMITK